MKNLLRALAYLPKRYLFGAFAAVAVAAPLALAVGTMGATEHIRYTPGMAGLDHPAFNAYYNVPNIGDERDFARAKLIDHQGFYDPVSMVQNGDTLLVRVYVHNGADPKHNASGKGVAKDTRVRVTMPSGTRKNQQMRATITSSNAGSVSDVVDVSTANSNGGVFELDYVNGSAKIKTNQMDRAISDQDLLSPQGVLIGDDKLDGNLNGCFEYVALVTFQVKVKMPRFHIAKKVSKDFKTLHEQVDVKPGDEVEWQLEFKNTGGTVLDDVEVYDDLPKGVTLVPGSTRIFNSKFPGGVNAGTDDLTRNGIDIGDYNPGANAFVVFRTRVNTTADLLCGTHKLTNIGYATPDDRVTVSDNASVMVQGTGTCSTPPPPSQTPAYACTGLSIVNVDEDERRVTFRATAPTATNGATFNQFVYDFGDDSEDLVTTQTEVTHDYADSVDEANARLTARFTVSGNQVTDSGAECEVAVSFDEEELPPTDDDDDEPEKDKPEKRIIPKSGELPETGPGSIIAGLFGTSAFGAAAQNWVASRRTLKKSALKG